MSLEYWYLFPISVGVATLAMASGIGGAVFFSPIFLLWLKLEPTVAIGTALITEFFGFSSGLIAYARSGLIDYRLGAQLLVFAVPGAIAGVIFGDLPKKDSPRGSSTEQATSTAIPFATRRSAVRLRRSAVPS